MSIMFYSIQSDLAHYMYIGFDIEPMRQALGDAYRFDMDRSQKSYKEVWKHPLPVSFDTNSRKKLPIPDISDHQGRLFLSSKAYQVLRDLLDRDGEFLPVIYDGEEGYMFNVLSLAEHVDGIDEVRCHKNEWGDIEHIAFHEDRVKGFAIFKTEFDRCYAAYCREDVKKAIEDAGLKGLNFSSDLAARYGGGGHQRH